MSGEDNYIFHSGSDTQDKILNAAAKLFALKGFKAVTLKAIAKEVGIKVASIYYYYEDKTALINDVLGRFTEINSAYQAWLVQKNENAETAEEVVENLFDMEYLGRRNIIARFGLAMAMRGQNNYESAHQYVFEQIYTDTIRNTQASFDRLVNKKIIPPSDTHSLATLYLYCILGNNEARLNELVNIESPIGNDKATAGFKKLLVAGLTQGIMDI